MGKGGGWWGDTPMHVVKPFVVTYAVFRLYHPPSRSKNDRCSPMCAHGRWWSVREGMVAGHYRPRNEGGGRREEARVCL